MSQTEIDENLLDEATEWFARLQRSEVGAELQQAFQTWLQTSPAHQAAYAQINDLWDSLAVVEDIPVTTSEIDKGVKRWSFWHSWLQWPQLVTVTITAVIAVVLFVFTRNTGPIEIYATQVGEQKEFVLGDGSHIYLNTNSQATVRLTEDKRLLYLDRGEIFFNVSHDPSRPFIVVTTGGLAKVLGTKFNIIRWQEESIVTVIEGSVGVVSIGKGELKQNLDIVQKTKALDVKLSPNEQIILNQQEFNSTPIAVDIKAVQAWQDRKLVYNGESFAQVIEDINRYYEGEFVIGDVHLENLKVIAVLDIQDRESMQATLEDAFDIRGVQMSDNTTVLYPGL